MGAMNMANEDIEAVSHSSSEPLHTSSSSPASYNKPLVEYFVPIANNYKIVTDRHRSFGSKPAAGIVLPYKSLIKAAMTAPLLSLVPLRARLRGTLPTVCMNS